MGLTPYAAQVLTGHPRVAAFFEEAATLHGHAVKVANFVQSEVLRDVVTHGLQARIPVSARQVASLLELVDAGTISGKQAKEVYAKIVGTDRDAGRRRGRAGNGAGDRRRAPSRPSASRSSRPTPSRPTSCAPGKTSLMGFFVGQVMKQTQGSANPKLVNDVLRRLLGIP